ncbi:protein kinase domain, partial [Cystoisospora suis]
YQLSKEIGKAIKEYFHTQYYKVEGNTQLISEDVTPKSIEHVYTSLRISPPPEGSELSHFILQRIDRSYVAWGTVDRLLRQALRLAVETNPSSSVQHVYQALQLGEEPSPENLQSFYSTIYSTFESLASQIYYRLPWESIESQAHYGISAKSMENYLRNTYIPLIAKM